MLSPLKYFPFSPLGGLWICLIVFLLCLGWEYAPSVVTVRVLTSVRDYEVGKLFVKPVVVIERQVDGQSGVFLDNQCQFFVGKMTTKREPDLHGNRIRVNSRQVEAVFFFPQAKKSYILRSGFMPVIWRGRGYLDLGLHVASGSFPGVVKVYPESLFVYKVNVHPGNTNISTPLGFHRLSHDVKLILYGLDRLFILVNGNGSGSRLLDHRVGLSFHFSSLFAHRFYNPVRLLQVVLHNIPLPPVHNGLVDNRNQGEQWQRSPNDKQDAPTPERKGESNQRAKTDNCGTSYHPEICSQHEFIVIAGLCLTYAITIAFLYLGLRWSHNRYYRNTKSLDRK